MPASDLIAGADFARMADRCGRAQLAPPEITPPHIGARTTEHAATRVPTARAFGRTPLQISVRPESTASRAPSYRGPAPYIEQKSPVRSGVDAARSLHRLDVGSALRLQATPKMRKRKR